MLAEEVRRHCASVAGSARHVTIHADAMAYTSGVAGLDPDLHRLDAPLEEVALYVLELDAINFGSGWFDELAIDTNALTRRLTAHGPWPAAELRGLTPAAVGDALGLDPAHTLTGLYAEALHQLGAWLGRRPIADGFGPSAQAFAAELVAGLPFFDDPGFFKRAQITANDLVLAGVANFSDVDRLTAFADNLLPHVLRVDGVLEYAPKLAAAVDAGTPLEPGSQEETELRACAVHACELLAARAGVAPRTLDNWLWNRGLTLPGRPHRALTVAY